MQEIPKGRVNLGEQDSGPQSSASLHVKPPSFADLGGSELDFFSLGEPARCSTIFVKLQILTKIERF